MEIERVLQIMRTELMCVKRNEDNYCDRKCEKCDLLLPTENVIQAYEEVITALERKVKKT